MPYVMVPVPEEHVEDVMNYMLRAMARANQEQWDQDKITELFGQIDELSKALFAYVARAMVEGREVYDTEAASAIQLSPREAAAIVRELNEMCHSLNRPVVIFRRPTVEMLPNGRTMDRFGFVVPEEIAPLVLEAEKIDMANGPTPGQS